MGISLFRAVEPSRSIFEHVRAHLPADGPGLRDGGEHLPDEDKFEGGIRWAPGALDGVGSHHFGAAEPDDAVAAIYEAIRAAVARPRSRRAYARLYGALTETPALTVADPLLERLVSSSLPIDRTWELGQRLAMTAANREPVKYGLALMGATGNPAGREAIQVLGRHSEFTLFAAVALQNIAEDAEDALWDLARQVDGWGRVHTVERLKDTTRPDIQDWILRDGFRHSVMDEYLVYIAATTGQLRPALERPNPDDELLGAACDILSALLTGGPAEDIDDYADGARATELLVGHLRDRAHDLRHFLTVDQVESFLTDEAADWSARERQGWTPELRRAVLDDCRAIKADDRWQSLATTGMTSEDPDVYQAADRAAEILGLSIFDANWRRAQADPLGPHWFNVMRTTTDATIDQVLTFAEQTLPLAEIATGPADQLGLGPEFAAHTALDFIVQDLGRFPGRGWPLIQAALRSPSVRNRNMAINALRDWTETAWPPDTHASLNRAAQDEPRDDVRQRLQGLLNGTLDD